MILLDSPCSKPGANLEATPGRMEEGTGRESKGSGGLGRGGRRQWGC